MHDKRKVIEHDRKFRQGTKWHAWSPACVASAGARSFMLLEMASLTCILKFCTGGLGDRRGVIYSSPLINTLELAKCLPQERIAQHVIRDACILFLDQRLSRRLSDGTDGK